MRAVDPAWRVDAGDIGLADRETAAQLAPHASHLAGEEQLRAGGVDQARDHVLMFGARVEDHAADVERPASTCSGTATFLR